MIDSTIFITAGTPRTAGSCGAEARHAGQGGQLWPAPSLFSFQISGSLYVQCDILTELRRVEGLGYFNSVHRGPLRTSQDTAWRRTTEAATLEIGPEAGMKRNE